MSDYRNELERLLHDRDEAHPAEMFRGVDDGFWLWMHTEGRESSPALAALLPGMPTPGVQQKWTGKTGHATMEEGFDIYRTMRDLHVQHVGALRGNGPVLDFGCGWGRVIRFFVKDVDEGELLGTDYNQALIDYCVGSDPWCTFSRNEARPPLPFADGQLGYVYAYSVFSHFSEEMHLSWLSEFRRVLRPGGALALTVRPRRFIEHCQRVRAGEATSEAAATVRMFPDADAALAAYDRGEFCHTPYYATGADSWWGEACIPREYIQREWGRLFEVVEFVDGLRQHVVFLRA